MVQVDYAYLGRSCLSGTESNQPHLDLSTSGGPEVHPTFFSGFVEAPNLVARLLLSVSGTASTRYHTPAAMRDAALRAADPVVTSDGTHLRFESFSGCGSVYCRADLLEGSLGDGFCGSGSTNVDFNAPMRNALSRLNNSGLIHLSVGGDEVALATPERTIVEKKVRLPERWVRGFGEVQVAQSRMAIAHDLPRAAARRFLSNLSAARTTGQWWAVPATGGTLAISSHPDKDAVTLAGIERVRVLTAHAGGVQRLRVFTGVEPDGPVAWLLDFGAARLSLVTSPDARRGFSGEGAVLDAVADPTARADADRVSDVLEGSGASGLTPRQLTERTGLDTERARRAADVVSATGRAGYDLGQDAWFARILPFGEADMARIHPRLGAAVNLGGPAVRVFSVADGMVVARVKGRHGAYFVRDNGREASCTCPWYAEHAGRRGPCKHVLAVRLARP